MGWGRGGTYFDHCFLRSGLVHGIYTCKASCSCSKSRNCSPIYISCSCYKPRQCSPICTINKGFRVLLPSTKSGPIPGVAECVMCHVSHSCIALGVANRALPTIGNREEFICVCPGDSLFLQPCMRKEKVIRG